MKKSMSIINLINPNILDAEKTLKKIILQKKTVIIVGNCWVDYFGRAKSKLEPGERIIILKKDGALLVHRSTGYEPVNWQPPGCIFQIHSKKNVLEIKSTKRGRVESVIVNFDKIKLLSAFSLIDHGDFFLYATEKDMQKSILIKPSLLEQGFKPISYEKKIETGFLDIYGIDKNGKFVVAEIKRNTAKKEAVLQLERYIKSIKKDTKNEVRGILIAPNLAKDVHRLLISLGLEFKSLDPKKCAEIINRLEVKKISDFF